jgi:hypothetical protein
VSSLCHRGLAGTTQVPCHTPLGCENEPMLWTVSRVEGWSFPSVFSLPSRARWYHSSALPYSPCCRKLSPCCGRCREWKGGPFRVSSLAIEGSLVPLKCLAILPLLSKTEPMLLTVSRVEGWSFPSVFSQPSRARWYHSSALPYSPWLSKTEAML